MKKKKIPLLCRLGLHAPCPGYEKHLKDGGVCFDGIDRPHLTLYDTCYHCDERFNYHYVCLSSSTVKLIHKYTKGEENVRQKETA